MAQVPHLAGRAPSKEILPEESRQSGRQRVLRSGKIVMRDGSTSANCSIIDISPTGARVRLQRDQLIPLRFEFINVTEGTVHEASIIWFRFPDVGLSFKSSYSFDDAALPERLRSLRRLWVDSTTRKSDLS